MGKGTAIEWTHHTFNPWIGCTKVSSECKRCYAEEETFVRVQRSRGRELWGPTADRHVTSPANWREPQAWDRAAAAAGRRDRVFCASLADVAEDRPDLVEPRARLCQLILDTPNLDWLLLTKRLDDLVRLFPREILSRAWVGTTAGTKERMLQEVPKLALVPARVRFVSVEPLLEDVAGELRALMRNGRFITWLIAGGESAKPGGEPARPMHPTWPRGLRDVAKEFGIAFLFKQWGDWIPVSEVNDVDALYRHYPPSRKHPEGRQECRVESAVLQLDGRVEFAYPSGAMTMFRVGKKASGRLLDGRTWDELPEVLA